MLDELINGLLGISETTREKIKPKYDKSVFPDEFTPGTRAKLRHAAIIDGNIEYINGTGTIIDHTKKDIFPKPMKKFEEPSSTQVYVLLDNASFDATWKPYWLTQKSGLTIIGDKDE